MLRFYDIDSKYTDFLRTFDRQIPFIKYDKHDKFLCGIVLKICDHSYYAPVSSYNKPQRTNFILRDHQGNPTSSIRFSFMFPAPSIVLVEKNFKTISSQNYMNLLNTEYFYCKDNETLIRQKAQSVYEIGCNKNHPYNYTCCDFLKLEGIYNNFK
jgi:protein AbiQ